MENRAVAPSSARQPWLWYAPGGQENGVRAHHIPQPPLLAVPPGPGSLADEKQPARDSCVNQEASQLMEAFVLGLKRGGILSPAASSPALVSAHLEASKQASLLPGLQQGQGIGIKCSAPAALPGLSLRPH